MPGGPHAPRLLAMALFSLFRRRDRGVTAAPAGDLAPADQVREARQRARRRLIGAVLLLGLGIIGFPLLFETQPRPIPVDVVIDIPRKDQVAPLVAPGAKPVITERAADAGREVAPPAPSPPVAAAPGASPNGVKAAPAEPRPASAAPDKPVPADKPAVADKPAPADKLAGAGKPAPSDKPAAAHGDTDAARALAALEGRPAAKPEGDAAATGGERYVVQFGSFADAAGAREARMKVERLGIKTYLQTVEVGGEKRTRVRVGPFASRDDADLAAAKIKAAGLAAVILTI